jgi:CheY-like chemotaxis protein
LIIDDEAIYRKMVERTVLSMNHTVVEAQDGKQGLDMAQSLRPDLIICDVVMPEMDGYTFTRTLRRLPGFERIPILILTAQIELEDRIKAFEAGADGHLAKPFDPPELAAWVSGFLKRAET